MHRLIVTSAAYRQSSRPDRRDARRMPATACSGASRRRRLEAETVRDAMLATAGVLDLATGGPGFRDHEARKATGTPTILYVPVDPATARAPPPDALSGLGPRRAEHVPRRLRLPRPVDRPPPTRRHHHAAAGAGAAEQRASSCTCPTPSPTRLVREAGPDAEAAGDAGLSAGLRATARAGRIGRARRRVVGRTARPVLARASSTATSSSIVD